MSTYDLVQQMEAGSKSKQLAESSLSMLLWPAVLLIIPGIFLRTINHFFGSAWNHKLDWFIHVFCNTGNVVLMASVLQSIINKVVSDEKLEGDLIENWHILGMLIYFWAYAFHNHRLMLNKITELFIIYEIVQTIIWSGFQIDAVDKRQDVPGCDKVSFFGDKEKFDDINRCYRFVEQYQNQAKSNMSWFFYSWLLACILNRACCWLSTKISMWGCNPVLYDDHAFISYYNMAEETHENSFGHTKPTPMLETNNPRVQRAIDSHKNSKQLEKAIDDFRAGNSDKGMRELKQKLKVPQYDDLKMFQPFVFPHILRWVYLGYSILFAGVSVAMIMELQEPDVDMKTESKFIFYNNTVANRQGIKELFAMIVLGVVLVDDFFMIWYNFIKYKVGEHHDGKLCNIVKYIKWMAGALCFWQFGYLNLSKYFDIKDARIWWSILCLVKLFLNVPLKYPDIKIGKASYLLLGQFIVEAVVYILVGKLWEADFNVWWAAVGEINRDLVTTIAALYLTGLLILKIQGILKVSEISLGTMLMGNGGMIGLLGAKAPKKEVDGEAKDPKTMTKEEKKVYKAEQKEQKAKEKALAKEQKGTLEEYKNYKLSYKFRRFRKTYAFKVMWWKFASTLFYIGGFVTLNDPLGNTNHTVVNLLCGIYYLLKLLRHNYLAHPNFKKIAKVYCDVESAVFVCLIVGFIWRIIVTSLQIMNGEPLAPKGGSGLQASLIYITYWLGWLVLWSIIGKYFSKKYCSNLWVLLWVGVLSVLTFICFWFNQKDEIWPWEWYMEGLTIVGCNFGLWALAWVFGTMMDKAGDKRVKMSFAMKKWFKKMFTKCSYGITRCVWKCRCASDMQFGDSWIFGLSCGLVYRLIMLCFWITTVIFYAFEFWTFYNNDTATFKKVDAILTLAETGGGFILGVLIAIPSIGKSDIGKTFRKVYRILFIINFANLLATSVQYILMSAGKNYFYSPVPDPEWTETQVLSAHNLFIAFAIANGFVAILPAFWEYHYVPLGRGWLLFWMFFFKGVVVFWNHLRAAIFQKQAAFYLIKLFMGSFGFMLLCAINGVVYSMVQIGCKMDYRKLEAAGELPPPEEKKEVAKPKPAGLGGLMGGLGIGGGLGANQGLIKDSEDLDMKHLENLLTDFSGCDHFFKKIIVEDIRKVHGIEFIFETVKYTPDKVRKIRAKMANRGVLPDEFKSEESDGQYSHGDTEVWNSMDTASELDDEHLGLDFSALEFKPEVNVEIEMQATEPKNDRKSSRDVEAGDTDLGIDVVVLAETQEFEIPEGGVEVEVEIEVGVPEVEVEVEIEVGVPEVEVEVEIEVGVPEVEVEVEVELNADVNVNVEVDAGVEVELDVNVDAGDAQE